VRPRQLRRGGPQADVRRPSAGKFIIWLTRRAHEPGVSASDAQPPFVTGLWQRRGKHTEGPHEGRAGPAGCTQQEHDL
jgi:hypothetical protein